MGMNCLGAGWHIDRVSRPTHGLQLLILDGRRGSVLFARFIHGQFLLLFFWDVFYVACVFVGLYVCMCVHTGMVG
jgi:hypothetical protein